MTPEPRSSSSRRAFLRQGGAAAGLAAAPSLGALRAGPEAELKIALVGCGGRGTGAAHQALNTHVQGPVRLWAMADAFQDRLESSLKNLQQNHGPRVEVPEERRFTGFDAYQKAIDSGVDVVILATPPGFRPIHFEYAVRQGKHVFMEKPVAVDAPGVRRVLAAAREAQAKNLKVGVGLQRHHQPVYQATLERLRNGALGRINLLRCYWNSGGVWVRQRRPEQTEMEYQMRNWYYFNWLCGDHIVEQHIHNLDVGNWLLGEPPVRAQGQGGRQVRTGREFGEIYDHHMVEFTYADGTKMLSQCRHIQGCWNQVDEFAHGSAGSCHIGRGIIRGHDGKVLWRYEGPGGDPYQIEHDELFAAIRQDRPYNEAGYGALSTMTAIFGRMATYSGQMLEWDRCLESEISLAPKEYSWDAPPPVLPDENGFYPVAMPGQTKVL